MRGLRERQSIALSLSRVFFSLYFIVKKSTECQIIIHILLIRVCVCLGKSEGE